MGFESDVMVASEGESFQLAISTDRVFMESEVEMLFRTVPGTAKGIVEPLNEGHLLFVERLSSFWTMHIFGLGECLNSTWEEPCNCISLYNLRSSPLYHTH